MTFNLARNPILALAAIALSGSIALSQQTPAQPTPPAPPADATTPAAPIERQPPSDRIRPRMGQGMHQGQMRSGMMQRQHNGPGNFRGSSRMNMRGNFSDGGDGFHGRQGGAMGAFHIAPPGMWWKNPMVVQRLTLTPEQTKKMDDIFQKSRIELIDLKANVEKQQVLLEPMLSVNPLDSAKAMAQIDKVAQSRAELEKANARMLLGIRAVLTPDQWTKLRDHQGPGGPGQQGGPDGQTGPSPTGGPGRTHGMRGGGPPPSTTNFVEPIDQP